jgi:tRNA modification GTPase
LVSETVAIGGIPVKLVDTAGIRRALDEAESIGIRKSMEALADADLVLVVFDSSQPLGDEDKELFSQVAGRPAIAVANKTDLAGGKRSAIAELPAVATSATTGEGIFELRNEILRHVGGDAGIQLETGFITNLRHQERVRESLTALAAAKAAVELKVPHEMLLLDLYNALRPLDEITGATTTDDILNLIFSTFCIGK